MIKLSKSQPRTKERATLGQWFGAIFVYGVNIGGIGAVGGFVLWFVGIIVSSLILGLISITHIAKLHDSGAGWLPVITLSGCMVIAGLITAVVERDMIKEELGGRMMPRFGFGSGLIGGAVGGIAGLLAGLASTAVVVVAVVLTVTWMVASVFAIPLLLACAMFLL